MWHRAYKQRMWKPLATGNCWSAGCGVSRGRDEGQCRPLRRQWAGAEWLHAGAGGFSGAVIAPEVPAEVRRAAFLSARGNPPVDVVFLAAVLDRVSAWWTPREDE